MGSVRKKRITNSVSFILHKSSPLCAHRHTYLYVLFQPTPSRTTLFGPVKPFYWEFFSFLLSLKSICFAHCVLVKCANGALRASLQICVCVCLYTSIDLIDSLVGHWMAINTRTR